MESNIVNKMIEPDVKLGTVDECRETAQQLCSGSFDMFEQIINNMSKRYTPEYLEQLGKTAYNDDRNYPENFSNWYKHIVDFGAFSHAEIIANQIFTYEETKVLEHSDVYDKVDWKSIEKILEPTLEKMQPYTTYNIKNGCFSNKFDFNTSLATKKDLAQQLWKINYASSLLDTGGHSELVVRELIPYNPIETPTIYNGMPLREEIRVFYNMDKNILEYTEDYWKYKYCSPHIKNMTDKIIFDWFHNKLKTRKIQHRELMSKLADRVYNDIHTLKFDGELKGIWSIDFMYDIDTDKLYLIDMARGTRSAYWNVDKLTYSTRKEFIERCRANATK